jgi:hypothetical protein
MKPEIDKDAIEESKKIKIKAIKTNQIVKK